MRRGLQGFPRVGLGHDPIGKKESQTALPSFKNSGFETFRTMASSEEAASWPWPASSSPRGSASRRGLHCPPAPRRQEASEELDKALASRGRCRYYWTASAPSSLSGRSFVAPPLCSAARLPPIHTEETPRLCAPALQRVCLFAARTDAHTCKLIRKACYEPTIP